jgi:Leishmanolysin
MMLLLLAATSAVCRVTEIDGVGNTLAQSTPIRRRSGKTSDSNVLVDANLPVSGVMDFDSADTANALADGSLLTIVTHEMGHVLGIGELFFSKCSTCELSISTLRGYYEHLVVQRRGTAALLCVVRCLEFMRSTTANMMVISPAVVASAVVSAQLLVAV